MLFLVDLSENDARKKKQKLCPLVEIGHSYSEVYNNPFSVIYCTLIHFHSNSKYTDQYAFVIHFFLFHSSVTMDR